MPLFMLRLICCLTAIAWLLPCPVVAANLTIHILGLRSLSGTLRLSLYDRPDTFLKADGRMSRLKAPVDGQLVTVIFPDLPPGTYAVTVHHDEDNDGQLNRDLVGIPREGYGFSNDARVFFGPPSFGQAAIQLDMADKAITITMRYLRLLVGKKFLKFPGLCRTS